MKRLFALLLVLVMVVGLMAACGKKADPTDPTTKPTGGAASQPTDPTKNEKPFKGKELQVFGGYNPAAYGDITKMTGEGNYLWMINAAIEEWATINEVTVVYKGKYDANSVMAHVNAGERPDVAFFGTGAYPAAAAYGVSAIWTDEEYEAICDSLDMTMWVDMTAIGGKTSGVIYPWIGNNMLFYNTYIFEECDAKTPAEYFMDGEWTWEALYECMEATTKDLNNDGKNDYVGLREASVLHLRPFNTIDDKGALTMDVLDTQMAFDWIQLREIYQRQKKFIATTGAIASNAAHPLCAMQISDCEPYNWKHTFGTVKGLDHQIMAVPMPVYESKDGKETYAKSSWSQGGMFMLKATDEREASVSLIKYVLEAGQKYMEMLSDGVVKTQFAGLTGASETSKAYMEAFTAACAQRKEDLKAIEAYDPDLVAAYYEFFEDAATIHECGRSYAGLSSSSNKDWWNVAEISSQDAASALAAAKTKYQALITTYNTLYVPGWVNPFA